MFCDGTLENGVDDIGGFGGQRIRVAATFENGVHKLRPGGKKIVAVTRQLSDDGTELLLAIRPGQEPVSPSHRGPDGPPGHRAAVEAAQA